MTVSKIFNICCDILHDCQMRTICLKSGRGWILFYRQTSDSEQQREKKTEKNNHQRCKKKKKQTHNCSDRWKCPRKRGEVWDKLLDGNEGWIINGGKYPLLIEVFDDKCCVEQLADGHSSSSEKLADIVGMVIYHQNSILLDLSPSTRWLSPVQRWFARFCHAKELPFKKKKKNMKENKKNATLFETLLLAAEHKRVWDSCNDGPGCLET